MSTATETIEEFVNKEYKYGFTTNVETDTIPPGLNEDVVRLISLKKNEPKFLLDWRLKAYRHWLTLTEPKWHHVHYPPIDYQASIYYAAPRPKKVLDSLDEVDPWSLLKTFEKLGILCLNEQKRLTGVAVDAVVDSVSVATTFQKDTPPRSASFSVLFQKPCKNIRTTLVEKYLGSVVPNR